MLEIATDPLLLITGALLILFIAVAIILLIHGGIFSPIDVVTRCSGMGPLDIAYKYAKGSIEDSGPLFTESHSILPNNRTIGIYYHSMHDESKKNDKNEMRHIVGIILNDPGKQVTTAQKEQLEGFGYSFASFPAVGNSVQTSFPFRSTLSVIISVHRIYPAISSYMKLKQLCGHPVMEVYDSDEGKIFFVVPLDMQDKFYVPEAKYLLNYNQASSDDDNTTVSFDDSASFIRSEEGDIDSIEDDSSVSRNNRPSLPDLYDEGRADDAFNGASGNAENYVCEKSEKKLSQSESPEQTDESEGTDSSYEKIDPTEAAES